MINRLVLVEGLFVGSLSSEQEYLVLDGPAMTTADLGLMRKRERPCRATINCPFAVDRTLGRVYFSDGLLHQMDLATETCVEIAGRLPLGDATTQGTTPQRSPIYLWSLSLSPDGTELVALYQANDYTFWIVRIRPGTGVTGYWRLDIHGLPSIDPRRDWLCHLALEGPRIYDLDGNCLIKASAHCIHQAIPRWDDKQAFERSAFRPGSAAVALDATPGIVLWDLNGGQMTLVDEDGTCPAWSNDGQTLWYMRGQEELWRWRPAEGAERIAALEGPAPPEDGTAATLPVPSPCGRYLYAQLGRRAGIEEQGTSGSAPDTIHGSTEMFACVIDLEAGVVNIVPDEYHVNVAWLR